MFSVLLLIFIIFLMVLQMLESFTFRIPLPGSRVFAPIRAAGRRTFFKLNENAQQNFNPEASSGSNSEAKLLEFVRIFKSFGLGSLVIKEMLSKTPAIFKHNSPPSLEQKLEFINREIVDMSQPSFMLDPNLIGSILPDLLCMDFEHFPAFLSALNQLNAAQGLRKEDIEKEAFTHATDMMKSGLIDENEVGNLEEIDPKELYGQIYFQKDTATDGQKQENGDSNDKPIDVTEMTEK
jgi:hypothetical protein